MAKETDKVLDHNYDDIKEYDNPLPNWWLLTFYTTIIFAFGYFFYYIVGNGPTLKDELAKDMQYLSTLHGSDQGPVESEEQLAAKMAVPGVKERGQAVFAEKCMPCHGDKGQGLVGPNLTDNYWIHGKGTRSDILTTVQNGVPDKGMPAWKDMLPAEDIVAAAAFVHSLKGTNPPNPKPPQGEKVE